MCYELNRVSDVLLGKMYVSVISIDFSISWNLALVFLLWVFSCFFLMCVHPSSEDFSLCINGEFLQDILSCLSRADPRSRMASSFTEAPPGTLLITPSLCY